MRQQDVTLVDLFKSPAYAVNLALAIGGLFVYYAFMGEGTQPAALLLTICFAIPGILAKRAFSPILFLVSLAILSFDPTLDRFFGTGLRIGRPRMTVEDGLIVFGILAYLLGQYRLLAMVKELLPAEGSAMQAVRPIASVRADEWKALLLTTAVLAFLGLAAWFIVQVLGIVYNPFRLARPLSTFLMFFWLFAFGLFASRAATATYELYTLNLLSARLIVQETFWKETRREQERLYNWMRWARRKPKE